MNQLVSAKNRSALLIDILKGKRLEGGLIKEVAMWSQVES